MGEAKRRGTFDQRRDAAIQRAADEPIALGASAAQRASKMVLRSSKSMARTMLLTALSTAGLMAVQPKE